jgi:hypothetical protein
MLKRGSRVKAIGTPVACPACRHPNPGINIWCERCRTPLDWNPATTVTPRSVELPRRRRPLALPRLTVPPIAWPRVRLPVWTVPRPRMPQVPRIALVVAAILAVLLIVPLAYVLLPAGRAAVDQQRASSHLPSINGATADTAQAAAIPGVEAKTHLQFHTGTCDAGTPCLTVASVTMGKDAAAVIFSTASSAARQCVGYVYRSAGRWHFLSAVCGLADKLSPLIDRDAAIRISGNCANVREAPSLKAHVVACLTDGTTVHIDGGPTYADSRLWWHQNQGWMAQDFLTGT